MAREIELLAPAVDDGGRRPDNCEYPWEAGSQVVVPAQHRFHGLSVLKSPTGSEFLKLLRLATDQKIRDLTEGEAKRPT